MEPNRKCVHSYTSTLARERRRKFNVRQRWGRSDELLKLDGRGGIITLCRAPLRLHTVSTGVCFSRRQRRRDVPWPVCRGKPPPVHTCRCTDRSRTGGGGGGVSVIVMSRVVAATARLNRSFRQILAFSRNE